MMQVIKSSLFDSWFKKIKDPVIQGRIVDRLSRVSQGNFGDHKSVGEGVFEMRLKFGSGYRINYTVLNETIVFLLAGGDKSSQREDIKKAKELTKELP